MADIKYWDDSLSTSLQSITTLLSSLPTSPPQRLSQLNETTSTITRTKNTIKSYKMECRLIKDGVSRREYEDKLGDYENMLGRLEGEVKWKKTEGGKKELFGGVVAGAGAANGGSNSTGNMDASANAVAEGDAILTAASGIQDKTSSSLLHTRQMVDATKEIGAATLEELHRQRDQIKVITDEVMTIEDNLTRADKLIKTFGRRMATDKFIQCFACVNVLLLVGVIIYAIVSGNSSSDNSDNKPNTPF